MVLCGGQLSLGPQRRKRRMSAENDEDEPLTGSGAPSVERTQRMPWVSLGLFLGALSVFLGGSTGLLQFGEAGSCQVGSTQPGRGLPVLRLAQACLCHRISPDPSGCLRLRRRRAAASQA